MSKFGAANAKLTKPSILFKFFWRTEIHLRIFSKVYQTELLKLTDVNCSIEALSVQDAGCS